MAETCTRDIIIKSFEDNYGKFVDGYLSIDDDEKNVRNKITACLAQIGTKNVNIDLHVYIVTNYDGKVIIKK